MISKSATALAATGVGGTGAAAVGGAYYLGAFGDTSPSSESPPQTLSMHQTIRESFANKQTDDFKCLDNLLAEVDAPIRQDLFSSTPLDKAQEITEDNQLDPNFLNDTSNTFNNCLVVHWDKHLGQDNKWHGNFRWLWVFAQEDKAIVMFNVLETSTANHQLNLFGGVYFINKNSTRNWQVHQYKKFQTPLAITSSNFGQKFPKVGDGIAEKNSFGESKDLWGFVSGADDLKNICLGSVAKPCEEDKLTTTKSFKGKWTWQKDSGTPSYKPIDWAKDPDSWFPGVYSDITKFKDLLATKFSNLKGKWIKDSLSITPTSN